VMRLPAVVSLVRYGRGPTPHNRQSVSRGRAPWRLVGLGGAGQSFIPRLRRAAIGCFDPRHRRPREFFGRAGRQSREPESTPGGGVSEIGWRNLHCALWGRTELQQLIRPRGTRTKKKNVDVLSVSIRKTERGLSAPGLRRAVQSPISRGPVNGAPMLLTVPDWSPGLRCYPVPIHASGGAHPRRTADETVSPGFH